VFLLETDLLGNRTYATPDAYGYAKSNPWDGCPTPPPPADDCTNGCQVATVVPIQGQVRIWTSGQDCAFPPPSSSLQGPACSVTRNPPADFTTALQHVRHLYAVLGSGGSSDCGGSDNNRAFWQADDPLIQAWRNLSMAPTEWVHSTDPGGSHAPFTVTRETAAGRTSLFDWLGADGQVQLYVWDNEAVAFTRGGQALPADSHMFEIDDDFDWPWQTPDLTATMRASRAWTGTAVSGRAGATASRSTSPSPQARRHRAPPRHRPKPPPLQARAPFPRWRGSTWGAPGPPCPARCAAARCSIGSTTPILRRASSSGRTRRRTPSWRRRPGSP
jgi:hypothetical protein